MRKQFTPIAHFIIGRGLVPNPFLPSLIKTGATEYPADLYAAFREFHYTVYEQYALPTNTHKNENARVLGVISQFTDHPKRTYKAIEKASNHIKYMQAKGAILATQK